MARVFYGDKIFFSEARYGAENQFGVDLDPLEWKSVLPGLSFTEALTVDPSLQQSYAFGFDQLDALGRQIEQVEGNVNLADSVIRDFVANQRSELASMLNQMAAHDIVTALRGVIGQVAVTVGYAKTTLDASVRHVFSEPLQGVMLGLSIANSVIESELFQAAIDNITWIPVVGWIIQLLLGILTLIAKIGDQVRRKRMKRMSVELAKRFHLPLLDSDPDMQRATNEAMTRRVMSMVKEYRLEKVFQPPYLIPGGSWEAFDAVAARSEGGAQYTDEYGNTADLTQAWYLFGRAGGGAGFVPGGSQMIRTLEFYTSACGAMPGNTGAYMSTATGMAGYLWQLVLQNGPAMYTVPTEQIRSQWDDYTHGLLEYADACVRKGFTCTEAGYPCSDWEWCGDWNYGAKNCNRASQKGKKVRIPAGFPSHFEELAVWVGREFWGRGADKNNYPYEVRDTSKPWSPDHFHFSNTVYAMALKNLRERQLSILGDYTALLVTPATSFEEPNGVSVTRDRGMFPALALDRELQDKWEDTVTRIVADPKLLAHVDYREIPEYRWKGQSLRETVRHKQSQTQGYLAVPGGAAPPPVPGGPSEFPPPGPPNVSGLGLTSEVVKRVEAKPAAAKRVPLATRVLWSAAAGMGIAAGGYLVYNGVRRRYFS